MMSIYRAIKAGHDPIALLVNCDDQNKHSWFHNIPYSLLSEVSKLISIPIVFVDAQKESYANDFENALLLIKNQGAQMCVFGDIDIQEHFDWCNDRCISVGLKSSFPLWQFDRKELVHEFIDNGFKALITVINTDKMNEKYIGKVLTQELVNQIEKDGVDICGENGEYHTFVFDGPMFKSAVRFNKNEIIRKQNQIRILIQDKIV